MRPCCSPCSPCSSPCPPRRRRQARHLEHRLADLQPAGDPDLPRDVRPRTAEDFALLRGYADRLAADVVAIQEVDGPAGRRAGLRPRAPMPSTSPPRTTSSAPASPCGAACTSRATRTWRHSTSRPMRGARCAAAPTSRCERRAGRGCGCSRCISNAGCRERPAASGRRRECESLGRQARDPRRLDRRRGGARASPSPSSATSTAASDARRRLPGALTEARRRWRAPTEGFSNPCWAARAAAGPSSTTSCWAAPARDWLVPDSLRVMVYAERDPRLARPPVRPLPGQRAARPALMDAPPRLRAHHPAAGGDELPQPGNRARWWRRSGRCWRWNSAFGQRARRCWRRCSSPPMPLAQLPVGVAIDLYGARRVQTVLALVAAAGFAALRAWRRTAGAGARARRDRARHRGGADGHAEGQCAMVPEGTRGGGDRRAASSSAGMGGMAATVPVQALLPLLGWRGIFLLLAVLACAVSLWIWLSVPRAAARRPGRRRAAAAGAEIARIRPHLPPTANSCGFMPAIALLSALDFTYQGLWAGPWLRDVGGLDDAARAAVLLFYALGMMTGQPGRRAGGLAACRRAASTRCWCPVSASAAMVVMQARADRCSRADSWRCCRRCGSSSPAVGSAGPSGYAVMAQRFPPELTGRVATAHQRLACWCWSSCCRT